MVSPWWLDNNHAPPGAGYLNLLTFVYLKDIFTDTSKTIDLRNKTLYLEIFSKNINLKGSNLVFWFQSRISNGKFINFAYSGNPIVLENNKLVRLEITLKNNINKWICLGANAEKTEMYGYSTLDQAMSKVNNDFGLIIFPTSPDSDIRMQPEGEIFLKIIGIK